MQRLIIIAICAICTSASKSEVKSHASSVVEQCEGEDDCKKNEATCNYELDTHRKILTERLSEAEYLNKPHHVFLQSYPMNEISLVKFTEVLFCPSSELKTEFNQTLFNMKGEKDYVKVPSAQWEVHRNVRCLKLSFKDGGKNSSQCSGIILHAQKLDQRIASDGVLALNKRKLYFYGTVGYSAMKVHKAFCTPGVHCHSPWSRKDFHVVTNNCNTFTRAVLGAACGLSFKKPNSFLIQGKKIKDRCLVQSSQSSLVQSSQIEEDSSSAIEEKSSVEGQTEKTLDASSGGPNNDQRNTMKKDLEQATYEDKPHLVFLQSHPMKELSFVKITSVLFCPEEKLPVEFVKELTDDMGEEDFTYSEITPDAQDPDWKELETAPCLRLAYNDGDSRKKCSGITLEGQGLGQSLAHDGSVALNKRSVYFYGIVEYNAVKALAAVCPKEEDKKCHSNWRRDDFSVMGNNCNTFTSTVLHSVCGLSRKKPNYGNGWASVPKHGDCPLK